MGKKEMDKVERGTGRAMQKVNRGKRGRDRIIIFQFL